MTSNSSLLLNISWIRPVAPGTEETPSCHKEAEKPVETAYGLLKESLEPLGFRVNLIKEKLSCEQFKEAPLQSNRIKINGVSLTEFLPNSKMGSVHDETLGYPRPTIDFGGKTYTFLPHELIVQAGLIAAASAVRHSLEASSGVSSACCDNSHKHVVQKDQSSCGQSCESDEVVKDSGRPPENTAVDAALFSSGGT